MALRKLALTAVALLCGGAIVGCGDSDGVSAPVVKVSAEQRTKDLNAAAESTVKWLEGVPATDRQSAVQRSPQVAATLKGATDPALRQRIQALGIQIP